MDSKVTRPLCRTVSARNVLSSQIILIVVKLLSTACLIKPNFLVQLSTHSTCVVISGDIILRLLCKKVLTDSVRHMIFKSGIFTFFFSYICLNKLETKS